MTMTDLRALQARALADSKFWFPDVHERDPISHFALGLGGEAGEVLNVVKKWHRGPGRNTNPMPESEMRELLEGELPDVFIYLLDLASVLGIDLAEATERKRAELIARWGEPDGLLDLASVLEKVIDDQARHHYVDNEQAFPTTGTSVVTIKKGP